MGKDIFLDNGKKVQGSMTRYWKQQKAREKNRSKHPNQPSDKKQQQQHSQPTTSNYDKWKAHQENMIIKKYNKEQTQPTITQQIKPKEVPPVEQSQDTITKQVEENQTVIPGYSSKSEIHKKIHKTTVLKSKELPSSKNEVPNQLKGLFNSPEELQKILKANKLKNLEKIKSQKKKLENKEKQKSEDPFEKTLQDQQYNILHSSNKEQESMIVQQPPKQQQFFKSDLLNKIMARIKPQVKQDSTQKKQEKEVEKPEIEQPKAYRFIPRSVILKGEKQ